MRDYRDGGIEQLKKMNFYRPERGGGMIEEYFQEHPQADMKEATTAIEQLTGIRRSRNRVREYLDKIGMKRRKVGMIPAKADPEKRQRFVRKELKPRLKEAKQGWRAVRIQGSL